MFSKVDHNRLEKALSKLYTSVYGVEVKVTLKEKKDCHVNGNPSCEDRCNNLHKTKE